MKTILITGCSSGFGLEIARHFLARGWQVVATMRTPDPTLLPESERLRILPLDVTDPASIAAAVAEAGPLDALVNNAGIGWMAPFEATTPESLRQIFETNTFGTFEVIRAFLPGFRARGAGVIVNVSSSVTLLPLPLVPVYTASKAAVNAFSECLALELAPLGIRTQLVLPGRAPGTRFGSNARAIMSDAPQAPADYAPFIASALEGFNAGSDEEPTRPEDVVQAVWRAVTDEDSPFCQPAGRDAEALAG
ncbi:SDR family oxidoreductase [Pseudooceanicola sp. HF7]|uniref:SDR family oxidoreductase n=1 Tax=Pseudooceanicola sp. HF7 TaxID=2721560 RepID=UPI00142FF194|nr:SDR family oxidoreductase [Pseudooceanicola sp. HF7]NIZ09654.1 SDR family oxidoreductase [Pseudooceanicola sp. HF7]